MNIILIPKFSAVGAAIAAISTQLFTSLVQIFMAQNVFGFRKNYKLIGTIFLFIISVIAINSFISNLQLYWIIKLVLSASGCFALALISKLISIRNIYRIIKYEE